MEVRFDANGYPYDAYTGNLVTLEYDDQGNAIDQNTGQIIDTVVAPDQSTVYKTSQTPFSQILNAVEAQIGGSASIGYYPPGYPGGGYPTGPYGTGARYPSGATVGAGGYISPQGAQATGQVTLSKNTLLIGGLVLFVFLFARKK
jgi:hypothetical protein